MMKSCTTLAAFLFFATGCSVWPPHGQGGQAESFETAPTYRDALRIANKRKLECYDRTLQGLQASALRQRHPARLQTLSKQWTRALRAHAALMDREAQHDLIILAQEFNTFQKTLKGEAAFRLISTAQIGEEMCP